jgi:hypothetical protein
MQITIMLDGYLFALRECMRSEPIAGFIIVTSCPIVVEHPAGVLRTAGLVDEQANLFVLALPKPPDTTVLAMLLPELWINVPTSIKRRDDFIAVAYRALGVLLRARQVESDASELARELH